MLPRSTGAPRAGAGAASPDPPASPQCLAVDESTAGTAWDLPGPPRALRPEASAGQGLALSRLPLPAGEALGCLTVWREHGRPGGGLGGTAGPSTCRPRSRQGVAAGLCPSVGSDPQECFEEWGCGAAHVALGRWEGGK